MHKALRAAFPVLHNWVMNAKIKSPRNYIRGLDKV